VETEDVVHKVHIGSGCAIFTAIKRDPANQLRIPTWAQEGCTTKSCWRVDRGSCYVAYEWNLREAVSLRGVNYQNGADRSHKTHSMVAKGVHDITRGDNSPNELPSHSQRALHDTCTAYAYDSRTIAAGISLADSSTPAAFAFCSVAFPRSTSV
jgi:hypothetical protein